MDNKITIVPNKKNSFEFAMETLSQINRAMEQTDLVNSVSFLKLVVQYSVKTTKYVQERKVSFIRRLLKIGLW